MAGGKPHTSALCAGRHASGGKQCTLTEEGHGRRFFRPASRSGHFLFDLPGYIASRVQRADIVNFEDLGLCTYAEPERFFSYRRTTKLGEPDYGRHINAIALAD